MFQGTGALAFNATFYLQNNPDVFQAIQNGTFQGSALDHFVQFGQFEGRDPNAFFDTEYYLAQNPDVLTAIADPANPSVVSAFQHFVTFGFAEGEVRAPSAQFEGFNADTYLAANPDLQAAFGNLTGEALDNRLFQHFVEFGVNENRPGSGVLIDNTPGVPGESFTFTTQAGEVLTGTANNDTFTGVVGGAAPTFQAGDQANGAGGVDRLNLISLTPAGDATSNVVSGTILTNIEQVYARALSDVVLDATLWEGVEQLWSDRSGANTVSYTNVQEAATLGVNNVQGGTLNVSFADGAFAASDTLNIVSNSSTATINVLGEGEGPSGVSIAVTGENELVSNATGAIETLTITGNGSLVVDAALEAVTTVDASANTGGVDLDFTGNAEAVTVTGGAGNDRFDFGAGLTVEDTVDGGAGFDTVVVSNSGSLAAPAAAAAFNALKSIERVEFNGSGVTLQGSTFTNAGITNLLFNTAGADTVLNAGSARTYEFGNENTGAATFELKSVATTLNIDLLGDEGDAEVGGATVDAITVLYGTGTAATAVTTLNLTSAGEGEITNTVGDISIRAGSTIVIDGAADLTVGDFDLAAGGTAGAGITVDASGFTGDLTIGGSANGDIFTFADESVVEVVINAGESGQIDGPEGGTQNIVNFDVITGFTAGTGAGADVLNFAAAAELEASFSTVDADLSTVASNLLGAANFAITGGTVAGETVEGGGLGWTAFEFGDETYAVYNIAGDNFGEGDVIVQLSGVALDALTAANFSTSDTSPVIVIPGDPA